jgi:class 3 adenylate cyclase
VILPPTLIKVDIGSDCPERNNVTVLFADLVGFTQLASELSAIQTVEILNIIFSLFFSNIKATSLCIKMPNPVTQ